MAPKTYSYKYKPKTFRKKSFRPVPATAAGRGPFDVSEVSPEQHSESSYPLYNSKATRVGKFMAPGGKSEIAKAKRAHEYGRLITAKKGLIPKNVKTVRRHDKSLDPANIQAFLDSYINQFMRGRGVDEVDDAPIIPAQLDDEIVQEMPPHLIAGEVLRHYNPRAAYELDHAERVIKTYGPREEPPRGTPFGASAPKWKLPTSPHPAPASGGSLKPPEPEWKRNPLDPYQKRELARARNTTARLRRSAPVQAQRFGEKWLTNEQMNFLNGFWHRSIASGYQYYGPEVARMAREFQQTFGPWPPGQSPYEQLEREMELSPEEMKAFEQFSQHYQHSTTPPKTNCNSDYWGENAVLEMPKHRSIREALRALRPKPGFIGAFKFPHRADLRFSDGRAFARKLRRPGGTILLDCSGSMNLDEEDINQLLINAPAATVACYAQSSRNALRVPGVPEQLRAQDKDVVVLDGLTIIVAREGKATNQKVIRASLGCNNLVDGPALDWLSTQEPPLIWCSDAGVTTPRGHTDWAIRDAFYKVRKHKIKHVLDIDDCISLVRRLGGKR